MSNQAETLCSCGCGGSPHRDVQELKNLPGLSSLRFRAGTQNSFKAAMLKALSAKPALAKLTSRKDDDMAIAAIDAWATVLDVLTFYQERIINEGYIRTATERFSILELAQHISYQLRPGVAASTAVAFSMNDAPGAPLKAIISAGSKIQSIPEQDQLPQIFETTEVIEARVEWNGIKLQTKRKHIPGYLEKEIYLNGINTGLQPGDGLLMIGEERENNSTNENWDFRRVKEVILNADLNHTKVTWEKGLGTNRHGHKIEPAKKNFKVFAFRQRASLFGYNAPDVKVLSEDVRTAFTVTDLNKDWPKLTITEIAAAADTVVLDALYPKVIKSSWLLIMTDQYEEVYKVTDAVESSRKAFTLTAKTMAVQLLGENLVDKFNEHIRDAVIFAQSEQLEIAEIPVEDSIKNENQITLEKLMPDLDEGKLICITGKRKRLEITEAVDNALFTVDGNSIATRNLRPYDSLIILKQPEALAHGKYKWTLKDSGGFEGTVEAHPYEWKLVPFQKNDEMVSELHTILSIAPGVDPTIITLKEAVANYFDTPTVSINANVAEATNGETKQETLGSGNGSMVFQKFELKQTPLTFISAATPGGTATTLQVWVNDVLWKEVPSFYGVSAKDKVYTSSIGDDGKVTIAFGDGITGARLPTGVENIKATYRIGIGSAGLLNPGQLSMLLSPQLGVNKVTNPLATLGAADRETLDKARQNAPLTVFTLDRIVSAKDFEDFTRAFAGISKAKADILWDGEKQVVHITIAAEDKKPLDKLDDPYKNLVKAINTSGHSYQTVYVDNYTPLSFSLNAGIKINSSYIFEKVQEQVLLLLGQKFSFEAREFGQGVTPSEVIAVIQSVEGVVYTDLQQLNGSDPFSHPHFLLPSLIARWSGDHVLPAALLIIDTDKITITEIP